MNNPIKWLFGIITALFATIQKEWKKLPDLYKSQILDILKATNIIKTNLDKPAGVIFGLIETALGGAFVTKMIMVLSSVAKSLGINIAGMETDPELILTAILAFLKPKQGDDWKDTLLRISSYFVINFFKDAFNRKNAIPLVAYVYDNEFENVA